MTLVRFLLATVCSAWFLVTPALAQGVSGGLFGATRQDSGARDTLNIQMSLSQAFDTEVPTDLGSLLPRNDLRAGRHSTLFTVTTDFARERRRTQFSGGTSTYLRYNPRLDRVTVGGQSARIAAAVRLPKSGRLSIGQSASYSPSYLYQLLPVDPAAPADVPVNPEYRIDESESYSYRTNLGLEFGAQTGTRLTTDAVYSTSDFSQSVEGRPNQETYEVGARLSQASRGGGFVVGYRYRTGESGSNRLAEGHEATFGLHFSPAISRSRRLNIRLEVSPSVLDVPVLAPDSSVPDPTATRRRYPVQGLASIELPFKLKWRASAGYRRSVSYVAVLSEPVLTSGAHASLMGVIGRRLDVSMSARYAEGSPQTSGGRGITTYTGEARARFALSRAFALYSEYLYYYYDLADRARLAPGLPDRFELHGIRVGLTVFTQPLGR